MDLKIAKFFNRTAKFLDPLSRLISWIPFLFFSVIVLVASVFFLDKENGNNFLLAVIVALALHFLISEGIIKKLIGKKFFRVRPYVAHPNEIVALGKKHQDSSIPSSHMASSVAVLTVLIFFHPQFWPLILAFVLFMAFARIHNGMHYPSDVLIGTLLGLAYGTLALYFVNNFIL